MKHKVEIQSTPKKGKLRIYPEGKTLFIFILVIIQVLN